MSYSLELIGWKAWYNNGYIYTSTEHEWNDLDRHGLVVLKKFYHMYDEDGKKYRDEESESEIFSELVTGHSMLCLSIDQVKKYKRLPRCIKFQEKLSEEELQDYIDEADNDEEAPCHMMNIHLNTGKKGS